MRARDATGADHVRFLELLEELRLPAEDPRPDRAAWEREWMRDTFFVEDGGRIAGYAIVRVAGEMGLVLHVVVDPTARGRRVGGAVMEEAAARLRRAGCSEWSLNVRPDNAPAIALYERCGMRRAHESASVSITWQAAEALPREDGIEARVIAEEDDARFERAFALPRGRMAELRARPGRVLLGIVEDEPVALACLDPAFPGATPFRARRAALAAALIDAMRAHGAPGDRAVRLHVEDDSALERSLTSVGAVIVVRLVQMRGALRRA